MESDQSSRAELLGLLLNPTSAFPLAHFVTYFPACFAVVSGQEAVLLPIRQKCQGLAYLLDLDADASCAHFMLFPPQQDVERTQRQVPLKGVGADVLRLIRVSGQVVGWVWLPWPLLGTLEFKEA